MERKQARADLERELKAAGDAERARQVARYFKTGRGEYGEGDIFLGIPVPAMRRTALKYRGLKLDDIQKLLDSRIHEYRAAALEILVAQYAKADERKRNTIVDFYLKNTSRMNNWDLVDASTRPILGEHLKTHPRKILKKLAKSKSIWERRIAMVSTMQLVWAGELDDAFEIAEMLLEDEHDLIHKAVGWVLREAGIEDRSRLLAFLEKNYARLPRTTLRYAIEHFAPEQRKKMLSGLFARS
ncbi:MAG TPA: DNA alkylation repair protein [Alloacidobacterium sp.]|jgi:3-methyladenine DNA glycosylase AlkD|nr:DNA alkylation repair protein [Alloacidobacterium sp.]